MIIRYKIKDEKIQHDIAREARKISALQVKLIYIYIYKYLGSEEILPSN